MTCNFIDFDYCIIKIFNKIDIDIYDHDKVLLFIKNIYNKFLIKKFANGIVFFDIYIDKLYGAIIKVKNNIDSNSKIIDIKIKFNLNISFLYKVDYFYLLDNKIYNQNVYFYDNNYYLEIINNIDFIKYLNLLDNSEIIYDDTINNIINYGIKLANY